MTTPKTIEFIREWNRLAGQDDLTPVEEYRILKEEAEELFRALEDEDKIETLDAVADILFVVLGFAERKKLRWREALERVAENNLSKFPLVKSSGTNWERVPIKDKHGKIQKPSGFVPVDLSDLVNND